jgi:serine/threonine-protein kinase
MRTPFSTESEVPHWQTRTAAPSSVSPAPAEQIGPYRLLEKIGEGGNAEVFRVVHGEHRGAAREFALKRAKGSGAHGRRVARLCAEARMLSGLMHPNLVEVIDFGVYDGQVVMVTEHLSGGNCSRLLHRSPNGVPVGAAVFVADQVLAALEYIHAATPTLPAVCHRDVSPGNVLLGREGEVRLGDFGIARHVLSSPQPGASRLEGKPGYMAPEQMDGLVDVRSDLFATGVVLAELLMGKHLFFGRTKEQTLALNYAADLTVYYRNLHRVPPWCQSIVVRALAADPDERFQTAHDFRECLRSGAQETGVPATPEVLREWLVFIEDNRKYEC